MFGMGSIRMGVYVRYCLGCSMYAGVCLGWDWFGWDWLGLCLLLGSRVPWSLMRGGCGCVPVPTVGPCVAWALSRVWAGGCWGLSVALGAFGGVRCRGAWVLGWSLGVQGVPA